MRRQARVDVYKQINQIDTMSQLIFMVVLFVFLILSLFRKNISATIQFFLFEDIFIFAALYLMSHVNGINAFN